MEADISSYYEWHPSDDVLADISGRFRDEILMLVRQNVGIATDDLINKGVLWLNVDGHSVTFEFTDEQFELRKNFSATDVMFCGIETDKDADLVLAFLATLADRIKQMKQRT